MQISIIDLSLIILIEVCKMSRTGKKKGNCRVFSGILFKFCTGPSIQVAKIDQFIFSSL